MVNKHILYQKYSATVHTDAFFPWLFVFPSIPLKKIANIYKYKALLLSILEWHHIHTICFLSPDIAVATRHRCFFTLVVAGHPYHGCVIIWTVPFLGIWVVSRYCPHVMSRLYVLRYSKYCKVKDYTHFAFWKTLSESALQRLVLFTCHLQSDSAAHPQHLCQRWYSNATLGHCGLPNYIK